MDNTFVIKKLNKYKEACHEAAMGYIDIITNAAIDQSEIENYQIDPSNFSPKIFALLASRNLNISADEILDDYLDMMVLEKMIEMVHEIN